MTIGNQTLEEFAMNPDGKTYDGRKVVRWLMEAVTSKPVSQEEAEGIVSDALDRVNKGKLG